MALELTPKQIRFCEEYLIDLNAKQAAIRVGYSPKTAEVQASRLLSNAKVSAYIQYYRNKIAEKTLINNEWVILRFKEISDRCMQGEPVMIRDINGDLVESGEWKFDSAGANKATEMIGKHIGFFERDNEQKKIELAPFSNDQVDKIIQSLRKK
jgi:phage terminase small subunit